MNTTNIFNRENFTMWGNLLVELENEIEAKNLLTCFLDNTKAMSGREIGHSNAESFCDYIINSVLPFCETLKKYNLTLLNSKTEREHGDFYLINKTTNTQINCNVKYGFSKNLGQPNVCSMRRMFNYLYDTKNPYLLFKLRRVNGSYNFKIFDIFNHIECLTYNDGPGQVMFKESVFYKDNYVFKYLKTKDVLLYLYELKKSSTERLFETRNKDNEMLLDLIKKL